MDEKLKWPARPHEVSIGAASGAILVETVAPALFSANANGPGVAAAVVTRSSADGLQITGAVFRCAEQAGCVAVPVDVGSAFH